VKPRLSAGTILGLGLAVQTIMGLLILEKIIGLKLAESIAAAVVTIGLVVLHLFDPTAPDIPPPAALVREPDPPEAPK
jgi:hypothetical protein